MALIATGVTLVGAHVAAAEGGGVTSRPHRLLPDVTTPRIHSGDLKVRSEDQRTLLRLTNTIANRGRGPLEIYASAKSHNCDGNPNRNDRDALQRIYHDTNRDHVFERQVDAASEHFRFGCERYDPRAGHWNVFDLARYGLWRLRSGRVVAKTTKVAFCTVDSERRFPKLPGSPSSRYYPRGGCDQHSELGISVGWADEYYYGVPGQALDVTGVKTGRYCLVSVADPHNLLRESDNSNNARRTRIELHPRKKTATTLPGGCRTRT